MVAPLSNICGELFSPHRCCQQLFHCVIPTICVCSQPSIVYPSMCIYFSYCYLSHRFSFVSRKRRLTTRNIGAHLFYDFSCRSIPPVCFRFWSGGTAFCF